MCLRGGHREVPGHSAIHHLPSPEGTAPGRTHPDGAARTEDGVLDRPENSEGHGRLFLPGGISGFFWRDISNVVEFYK